MTMSVSPAVFMIPHNTGNTQLPPFAPLTSRQQDYTHTHDVHTHTHTLLVGGWMKGWLHHHTTHHRFE
jgi:hypothetical protein